MEIITLTNQKGGVAKTTTAHILATGLCNRNYKILIVDLDPQCNLSYSCNIDMVNVEHTLYDVFKEKATSKEAITSVKQGFDIISGGLTLAGADMDFTQTGREYMLRETLKEVSDNYDYCIIDTPPTLGILTVNALTASQTIIIPMTADIYAIQGLSQLQGLIKNVRKYCNPDLSIAGLLLTRYSDRTVISRDLKRYIEEAAQRLETKLFQSTIREAVAVRESQLIVSDIFTESPKSKVAKDYNDFIDEFLKGR